MSYHKEDTKMTYYILTRENLNALHRAWPDYDARWAAYDAAKEECHGLTGTAHFRHVLKRNMEPILAPAFEVLAQCGHPMGRIKKQLVAEGAYYLERIGATEGWVQNYGVSEGIYFELNQTWYLFKQDGAWFFKMREDNKTAHRIEEVA